MKSERLKKLENELRDLQKWHSLGLVPKKDLEKHKVEMESLNMKILEEKKRLIDLKENGEVEDFSLPKKSTQKQLYEHQSVPDLNDEGEMTETTYEMETGSFEADHTTLFDIEMAGEEKASSEFDTEEDPYSDKNRWKRSMEISDPESDSW